MYNPALEHFGLAEGDTDKSFRSPVQGARRTMKDNPVDIYGTQFQGVLYSPFSLTRDRMERLLLINFERDPDSVYLGFEPQVFNDPINGKGLMVIAYLRDGRIDIYHQPGLTLQRKNYDIVGKGLADLIERPLAGAHFDVGPQGVDVQFAFADKLGRPIAVRIRETTPKPRQPFPLLAPFPGATARPPSLPLVLLYDFYFVRRSGTEIDIVIDGKRHKPDTLPAPIDGARMYFVRYATDIFVLNWNETYDGPLPPLQPWGAGPCEDRDVMYDLVENAGHLEISKMRPKNARHDVRFSFAPPIPDVANLRDGAQTSGEVTIRLEESMGQISGVYEVRRSGDQVRMTIRPDGGWQPGAQKWSVRLIFFLARIFKNWPKTYEWTAVIDVSRRAEARMTSQWRRLMP